MEGAGMAAYPLDIFVDIGSVDYKHKAVGALAIHQKVVHDSAQLVGHHTVNGMTYRQLAYVARKYMIDKAHGIGPVNIDFAHVAHIEEAGLGAHRKVLGIETFVFYWHVVARKGRHLCSEAAMALVQAG